jgi:FkbM family methyltransferase
VRRTGIAHLRLRWLDRVGTRLGDELGGFRMYGIAGKTYTRDGFEENTGAVIRAVVEPGSVCIDAGSHQGFYSILLAFLVGRKGRVIAFEAHPDNVAAVRRNIQRNGLDDVVRVRHAALVGRPVEFVSLYPGRNDDSSAWNLGAPGAHSHAEAVRGIPALRLDDCFAPGDRLDFIKMDIEGAEVAVLRGARRILGGQRPILLIEFHGQRRSRICTRLFRRFGYRLYDVDRSRPIDFDVHPEAYHALAVPGERFDAILTRLGHGTAH